MWNEEVKEGFKKMEPKIYLWVEACCNQQSMCTHSKTYGIVHPLLLFRPGTVVKALSPRHQITSSKQPLHI
jgi:hypothetical protein